MYPFAADEAEMARRPIDWLGCVSSMCWYLEEGREEPIAMVGKKETLLIKCWANPSAREAALPRIHVSCCLTTCRSSSVYIGTTTDAPKPGRSLLQDYMYIPMY